MALEVIRETLPPEVTVLKIRGRITLGRDTRQLAETVSELEREGITRLVFDLGEVDYMDSAGLGILTRCTISMRNNGGAFHIAGANAKVQTTVADLVDRHRLAREHRRMPQRVVGYQHADADAFSSHGER